jgi:hypothetical protein
MAVQPCVQRTKNSLAPKPKQDYVFRLNSHTLRGLFCAGEVEASLPIITVCPTHRFNSPAMKQLQPDRQILAMTDTDLEQFVRDWVELKKKDYVEIERFTGPGDRGRDVVGYLTKQRHEGPWHNYQCKQYGKPIPLGLGLSELGKVLYYASLGEFTPPTKFYFVAPRNVVRTLRALISKPSELQTALIAKWDEHCATKIIDKQNIPIDAKLKALVEQWDFSRVSVVTVDRLLADPAGQAVMVKWFGRDPGAAPVGKAPVALETREMPYVRQLLDAYGEREAQDFKDHEAVKDHAEFGTHLAMQRERFFDADAFSRFYRDNTMSEEIDVLNNDMLHGVIDVQRGNHDDSLSRCDAVMAQAANVQPSGALSRYARVPVKQGICHHFANEGRLLWLKK